MALHLQGNVSNRIPVVINPNAINLFRSYAPNMAPAFVVMPLPPNCPDNSSVGYSSLQPYSQLNNIVQFAPARTETSQANLNQLRILNNNCNLLSALPLSQTNHVENNIHSRNHPPAIGPLPQYRILSIPPYQDSQTQANGNLHEQTLTSAPERCYSVPDRNQHGPGKSPLIKGDDLPPRNKKRKMIRSNIVVPTSTTSESVRQTPSEVLTSLHGMKSSTAATKKPRTRGRKHTAKYDKVPPGLAKVEPRVSRSRVLCNSLKESGCHGNEKDLPPKDSNSCKSLVIGDGRNAPRGRFIHPSDQITVPVSAETDGHLNSNLRPTEHRSYEENIALQEKAYRIHKGIDFLTGENVFNNSATTGNSSQAIDTPLNSKPQVLAMADNKTLSKRYTFSVHPNKHLPSSFPSVSQSHSINHIADAFGFHQFPIANTMSSKSVTDASCSQRLSLFGPKALYSSAKGVTQYNTTFSSSRLPSNRMAAKIVGTSNRNNILPPSAHENNRQNTNVRPSIQNINDALTVTPFSTGNKHEINFRVDSRNALSTGTEDYSFLHSSAVEAHHATKNRYPETQFDDIFNFALPGRTLPRHTTSSCHSVTNRNGMSEGLNKHIITCGDTRGNYSGEHFPLDLSQKSNRRRELDDNQHLSIPVSCTDQRTQTIIRDMSMQYLNHPNISVATTKASLQNGEVFHSPHRKESTRTDLMNDSRGENSDRVAEAGPSLNMADSKPPPTMDINNNVINKNDETPEPTFDAFYEYVCLSSPPVLVIDEDYESDEEDKRRLPECTTPENGVADKNSARERSQTLNGSIALMNENMNYINEEDQKAETEDHERKKENEKSQMAECFQRTMKNVRTPLGEHTTDFLKMADCTPEQYSSIYQETACTPSTRCILMEDDSDSFDYSEKPHLDLELLRMCWSFARKETTPVVINQGERDRDESKNEATHNFIMNSERSNYQESRHAELVCSGERTPENNGSTQIDGNGNEISDGCPMSTDQMAGLMSSDIIGGDKLFPTYHGVGNDNMSSFIFIEDSTESRTTSMVEECTDAKSEDGNCAMESISEDLSLENANNSRHSVYQGKGNVTYRIERRSFSDVYNTAWVQNNSCDGKDRNTTSSNNNVNRPRTTLGNLDNSSYSCHRENTSRSFPYLLTTHSTTGQISSHQPTMSNDIFNNSLGRTRQTPRPSFLDNRQFYEDISEDEETVPYTKSLPSEADNSGRMTSTPFVYCANAGDCDNTGERYEQKMNLSSIAQVQKEAKIEWQLRSSYDSRFSSMLAHALKEEIAAMSTMSITRSSVEENDDTKCYKNETMA